MGKQGTTEHIPEYSAVWSPQYWSLVGKPGTLAPFLSENSSQIWVVQFGWTQVHYHQRDKWVGLMPDFRGAVQENHLYSPIVTGWPWSDQPVEFRQRQYIHIAVYSTTERH